MQTQRPLFNIFNEDELHPPFSTKIGEQKPLLSQGLTITGDDAERLVFINPHATHHIQIGLHHLGYVLERKKRKTLGLYVDVQGVTVRAPRWVSVQQVETFIHEKASWLLTKIYAQQKRAIQAQNMRLDWQDGAILRYLGRETQLRIVPEEEGVSLRYTDGLYVLEVGLTQSFSAQMLKNKVEQWMRGQALALFVAKCNEYADQLGVQPQRIMLTNAKTRWGSANSRGEIRLHWRLIELPEPLMDYVVVHELAHLKEMNHSPRFWAVVDSVLPDYQQRKKELRMQTLSAC